MHSIFLTQNGEEEKKTIDFHFQWTFSSHTHRIIILRLSLTAILRSPPSTKVIYINTSLISLSTPLYPYVYSQLNIDFRYAHQHDTHAILLQNHHFLCSTFFLYKYKIHSFFSLLVHFFSCFSVFIENTLVATNTEKKKFTRLSTEHLTSGSFFTHKTLSVDSTFLFFLLRLLELQNLT